MCIVDIHIPMCSPKALNKLDVIITKIKTCGEVRWDGTKGIQRDILEGVITTSQRSA